MMVIHRKMLPRSAALSFLMVWYASSAAPGRCQMMPMPNIGGMMGRIGFAHGLMTMSSLSGGLGPAIAQLGILGNNLPNVGNLANQLPNLGNLPNLTAAANNARIAGIPDLSSVFNQIPAFPMITGVPQPKGGTGGSASPLDFVSGLTSNWLQYNSKEGLDPLLGQIGNWINGLFSDSPTGATGSSRTTRSAARGGRSRPSVTIEPASFSDASSSALTKSESFTGKTSNQPREFLISEDSSQSPR
jgi:hypothetical protein